jgi:hypothetical protein
MKFTDVPRYDTMPPGWKEIRGEEHLACCVNDGVLLGQQYGDVFVVRTFITYDMCCGQQQQEF